MTKDRAGALLADVAFASPSSPAAATDEEEVPLKNGSTVIAFVDGEMSMRDAKGRPFPMAEGQPMEAGDRRTIRMGREAPPPRSKAELERLRMKSG
jgi:hypothetical protein